MSFYDRISEACHCGIRCGVCGLSSARKRQTKLTRTEFQRMCFSFMFCLLGSGSVFFGFLFGLVWRVTCDFEKGGAGGACRTGQRRVATKPRPDS